MENAKLEYRVVHLVKAAKEADLKLEQMEQVSFSDFSASFHSVNVIISKRCNLSIGASKLLGTDKAFLVLVTAKNWIVWTVFYMHFVDVMCGSLYLVER